MYTLVETINSNLCTRTFETKKQKGYTPYVAHIRFSSRRCRQKQVFLFQKCVEAIGTTLELDEWPRKAA